MRTQIELAREGIIAEQMQAVATDEQIDPTIIRDRMARGQIVIPNNPFRQGGLNQNLPFPQNYSVVEASWN